MVSVAQSNLLIRRAETSESAQLGAIWHAAFSGITDAHGFPRDFSSPEEVAELMDHIMHLPNAYSAVAEIDGAPVGGGWLWENEQVAGIGPVFVRPDLQGRQTGRAIMTALIARSDEIGQKSVRLTQSTFNLASMLLYAKLGFEVVEPLLVMQGAPLGVKIPGIAVRGATVDDLDAMETLCIRSHGHTRKTEIHHAIEAGTAKVAQIDRRIVGYATDTGFLGHAVAESNAALCAILGSAEEFSLCGVMVPTRNAQLLRWCLDVGMRAKAPATLMARGWYQQPTTPFLPSALF